MNGFGISYVSIGSVCSEISEVQVKRFSFIVMGDGGYQAVLGEKSYFLYKRM